jgi:hypothetical protein
VDEVISVLGRAGIIPCATAFNRLWGPPASYLVDTGFFPRSFSKRSLKLTPCHSCSFANSAQLVKIVRSSEFWTLEIKLIISSSNVTSFFLLAKGVVSSWQGGDDNYGLVDIDIRYHSSFSHDSYRAKLTAQWTDCIIFLELVAAYR